MKLRIAPNFAVYWSACLFIALSIFSTSARANPDGMPKRLSTKKIKAMGAAANAKDQDAARTVDPINRVAKEHDAEQMHKDTAAAASRKGYFTAKKSGSGREKTRKEMNEIYEEHQGKADAAEKTHDSIDSLSKDSQSN